MKNTLILRCDDYAEMLVVDRYDDSYNISMQDSCILGEHNTIIGRLKRAFKIIFGKPVVYLDIWVEDKNKVKCFAEDLIKMINS